MIGTLRRRRVQEEAKLSFCCLFFFGKIRAEELAFVDGGTILSYTYSRMCAHTRAEPTSRITGAHQPVFVFLAQPTQRHAGSRRHCSPNHQHGKQSEHALIPSMPDPSVSDSSVSDPSMPLRLFNLQRRRLLTFQRLNRSTAQRNLTFFTCTDGYGLRHGCEHRD